MQHKDFRVRFETVVDRAFLHLSVYNWSKQIYQYGRRVVWPGILAELRRRGYSRVYATPFADDLVAQKLIGRFGFEKLKVKNGLCLMGRSTEGVENA